MASESFDAVLAEMRNDLIPMASSKRDMLDVFDSYADRLDAALAAEVGELRSEVARRTREVEMTYPVQRQLLARAEAAESRGRELSDLLRWMRGKWRNDRPVATVVNAVGTEVCDWIDRVDAAIDACMGATREQPDSGDVSAEAAGK